MYGARSNVGAALTRKVRKALAGRVESVTVKCSGFFDGGGEVWGKEIEPLMAARQILLEAGGIECSPIKTWTALPPCFYIAPKKVAA